MKLIIKNLLLLVLVTSTTPTVHTIIATPDQEAIYNQEIIDARSQATPDLQIQALINIVGEQNNAAAKLPRFTSQNQLNFFSAIIPLAKQQTQEPNVLSSINTLIQGATAPTSTMLQSGQKGYLTSKLLPAIAQKLSQFPAQTQPVAQPIQAPQPVRTEAISPALTPIANPQQPTSQPHPITVTILQNSLNQANTVKCLRNVQAFLTLAEGFTFTSDIQNIFSQLIVKIASDPKIQRSKAQDLKLALMQASTSPLLAPAQQAYVTNTLLQARTSRQQAQPVAKKKKKQKKQQVVQQAQPVVAIKQVATTPITLPVAVKPKVKKAKKSKSATIQSGDQKTISSLNKALKKTSTNAQITSLLALANTAQGKQFLPATQDAFGNALITIFKNRSSYRSAEQLLLKKLLIKAQQTPLLSTTQQQYVTTSMMKQLE